jgi:ornithine cyclodeaminase/alanine dehydrogenase-like protein (mu-crystallin family)
MKNGGTLKFAVLGTGFWAGYQLAGWHELAGVQPIAFYNRTIEKAQALRSNLE